jgi:hypothetical protein
VDNPCEILPPNVREMVSVPTGRWLFWRFQIPKSTQPVSARVELEYVSGISVALYLDVDVQPTPDKFKHRITVHPARPKVSECGLWMLRVNSFWFVVSGPCVLEFASPHLRLWRQALVPLCGLRGNRNRSVVTAAVPLSRSGGTNVETRPRAVHGLHY